MLKYALVRKILKFSRSIRGKIFFLAFAASFFSGAFVGGFYFLQMEETVLKSSIENLAGQTRLINYKFHTLVNEMKEDILLISKTPPINGIIRTQEGGGIDPLDASTLQEWRDRLGIIFKSVMLSREHYTQMRFIGLRSDGKEIVRVNKQDNDYEVVAADDLQSKSEESYFKDIVAQPVKRVQFSDVTYNMEHGVPELPLLPTLRAYYPVFDRNDALYGFIIINTNYRTLIESGFENFEPEEDVLIVNQSGDYMLYNHQDKSTLFEYHKNYTVPPPSYIQQITKLREDEAVFFEGSDVTYFVKLSLPGSNPNAFIGIALRVPKEVLLAHAYETGYKSFLLLIVLVSIALLVTLFLANRLTEPWEKLTEKILNIKKFDEPIQFSVECDDEVGKLTRAFQSLANKFYESQSQLKAHEKKLIETNKEYESLTYIASHDLRSPLINLKGFSTEIAGYLKEVEPYVEKCMHLFNEREKMKVQEIFNENFPEAIEFIQGGVERIDMMTNAMLVLSRTGRRTLEFTKINTSETLRKCIKVLSHQAAEKKVEFEIGELPEIVGDQLAIEQVFTNLIDNSMKYLSSERRGKIEISAKEHANCYEFFFKDNGRGIEEKDFHKVFAIFRRASNVFDTKGEGMGLSYVKTLIKRHGGEMTFTSIVNQETTFIFTVSKKINEKAGTANAC